MSTQQPIAPPPAQPTRICPHCAEPILAAAKVCKHCGKAVKTSISVGQIAGAGLILFLVFIFVMGVVGSW